MSHCVRSYLSAHAAFPCRRILLSGRLLAWSLLPRVTLIILLRLRLRRATRCVLRPRRLRRLILMGRRSPWRRSARSLCCVRRLLLVLLPLVLNELVDFFRFRNFLPPLSFALCLVWMIPNQPLAVCFLHRRSFVVLTRNAKRLQDTNEALRPSASSYLSLQLAFQLRNELLLLRG